jgi:hypothetical protein
MAAISIWVLSIIPYLAIFTLAQSTSHFINPPETKNPAQDPRINSIYRVGDIVNIAWSAPEPVVTLIINQADSSLTEIDYLPNSGMCQNVLMERPPNRTKILHSKI